MVGVFIFPRFKLEGASQITTAPRVFSDAQKSL
jgi:hypothetical protein